MKPLRRVYTFRCIFKCGAGLGLAWALFACANFPEPGESQVRYAEQHGYDTVLADLKEGRHLVILKCGGCHSLPRVYGRRRTPETWPHIMDSMSVRAKLSGPQDTLIRAYLAVASGQWRDSLAAAKAGSGR